MNIKKFSSKDASRLMDEPTKDILLKIMQFLEGTALLSYGFIFVEVDVVSGPNMLPHGLGYTPKDIILTSNSTNVGVTINYSQSDDRYIYITATGTSSLRLLIGTYGSIK